MNNKTFFHYGCLLISLSFSSVANGLVNGVLANAWDHPAILRLVMFKETITKQDLGKAPSAGPNRCTGFAISDSIVLTAGHCIDTESGRNQSAIVVQELAKDRFSTTLAETMVTDYKYEVVSDDAGGTLVPGCSIGQKPIYESKTLDLAVIFFPEGTFNTWVEIDMDHNLSVSENVDIYGFGSHQNSFVQSPIHARIRTGEFKTTKINFLRKSLKRVMLVASPTEGFADIGDSGGPAFNENNKVFGVISTVEEKCETELGEDYAMMNGITVFSSAEAKEFLRRALPK